MKATMVEFFNEYGQWVWHSVTRKTPQEAIKSYLHDNSLEAEVRQVDGDFIVDEEVRAYEITIED
jgi:hypothetical protein